MANFDLIQFTVPLTSEATYSPSRFDATSNHSGISKFTSPRASSSRGHHVTVDLVANTITIKVSSYVLREDYLFGLNRSTFPTALEALQRAYGLEFDVQHLYANSVVHRLDQFTDVAVEEDAGILEKMLLNLPFTKYRIANQYRTRGGQLTSLVFANAPNRPQLAERLTVYGKAKELQEVQRNWLDAHPPSVREFILSNCRDKLRVETNLKSQQKIRQFITSGCTPSLLAVLDSTERANAAILQRIYPATIHAPKHFDVMDMSLKEYPLYHLLESHGFQLDAIANFYRTKDPKNAARHLKPCRDLLARIQANDAGGSYEDIQGFICQV